MDNSKPRRFGYFQNEVILSGKDIHFGIAYDFYCNKCDFKLESGWVSYVYTEDDDGNRVECSHPIEKICIKDVLAQSKSKTDMRILELERVGRHFHCLCLECLKEMELDIHHGRMVKGYKVNFEDSDWQNYPRVFDQRKCIFCSSENVLSVYELVGHKCPNCNEGIIVAEDSGIIS